VIVDYSGYRYFLFEQDGRTMTVTMNRPDQLNAMTAEMHEESSRIFYDLALDHSIDVVIFTGAGRAFSAGGDIVGMRQMYEDTEMFDRSINEAKRVVFGILDCDKIIIAKVNGDAVGLGATMALFCDIIIAADHARFGDPHVRVGLAAGDGGAVIWPALLGPARAKQYLLTGDHLTGEEAARIGLINQAVPAEDLDRVVDEFAQRIANGASLAIQFTKMSVNVTLKQQLVSVIDASFAYEALSGRTEDHQEAVNAFREKRAPRFTGR
jgi:enoyl-CoA hydratase